MRRLTGVGILVGLMAAPPAAGQPGARPSFAAGEWTVSLTANVDLSGSTAPGTELSGRVTYAADASLSVSAGEVTAGTHEGFGHASVSVETEGGNGTGEMDFFSSGEADGPAIEPVLVGTGRLSGTMSINTEDLGVIDVPLDVETELGLDGAGIPLMIHTATCGRVTGDFASEPRAFLGAQGITTTGPSSFVALRLIPGIEADELFDQIDALSADATAFVADFRAGGALDVGDLVDLLEQSEAISARIRVVDECADFESGRFFASLVGPPMRQLLEAILESPDRVAITELLAAARAAYRAGAVGAGAEGDPGLEGRLMDEVESRLDAAIRDGDDFTITVILSNAVIMGWTEIAARAGAA